MILKYFLVISSHSFLIKKATLLGQMSKLIFGYARFQYIHGHHLTPHVKCISVSSCSNLPVHTARYRLPCCNWGREQAAGQVGTGWARRWMCLLFSSAPALSSPSARKQRNPFRHVAPRCPGAGNRGSTRPSVSIRALSPPPLTGRLHIVLWGWGLGACLCWLIFPFPPQFPRSHSQYIYCHCYPAIVFHRVSMSGQRKFSSWAGGLRSLLVMVGLTFPVVISLCLLQS